MMYHLQQQCAGLSDALSLLIFVLLHLDAVSSVLECIKAWGTDVFVTGGIWHSANYEV